MKNDIESLRYFESFIYLFRTEALTLSTRMKVEYKGLSLGAERERNVFEGYIVKGRGRCSEVSRKRS